MRDHTRNDGGSAAGVDAQIEALHGVVTNEDEEGVEWPTIGRIVLLRIDGGGEDEVVRPALVLGRGDGRGDRPGFIHLQVFLYPHDEPVAPGSRVRKFGMGYYARAPYGTECGEWRWPDRDEPEFFSLED